MRISLFGFVVLGVLAGCSATPQHTYVSTNTDLLRVGEKPKGNPATYIEKHSGYCVQITDSWRKDKVNGETIWLKNSQREIINCPTSGT